MILNRQSNPPALWKWLTERLPSSLEWRQISAGYGYYCAIYRKGEAPGPLLGIFTDGDPVADVCDLEVRLNYPEYFSDFEDLLRRWEKETGIEPTLTYWESPSGGVIRRRA